MKLNSRMVDISLIVSCLLFLEILIRTASPLLSGNIKQIYEIPNVAASFSESNNAVLFLGNSLIGNALNLTEFDRLANMNMPSYKVVPDGTTLWEWSCIIKNEFI